MIILFLSKILKNQKNNLIKKWPSQNSKQEIYLHKLKFWTVKKQLYTPQLIWPATHLINSIKDARALEKRQKYIELSENCFRWKLVRKVKTYSYYFMFCLSIGRRCQLDYVYWTNDFTYLQF